MKIGELFSIAKGKKPPTLFDKATATAIPFIKIQGIRAKGNHQYCEPSSNLVTCERDDVLLVWDGAYCGLTSFGLQGAIGSTIARLRPKSSDVFGPYAGHFLRSKFKELQKYAVGAAIPHINGGYLRRLEIPLPPLDEQKRIAAVLDKADALHRQRQESLQLTEKLLQSVFIDMFVRNPDARAWVPRSINWMAKNTKGAVRTGPFGSQLLHSEFVDHGIAVLGIDNAVKNRFEWGHPRFITPEKYQALKRYKVFPGDLIITIMGTLGRCAIVPDDIPEAINTKHLCCITVDHKKCIPEFLQACLLHHPDVLRQLGVRAQGAVMPGLNMSIIKGLEVPLPPIKLQEQFKHIITVINASRVDSEESQHNVESLFCALQKRAFRGELNLSRLSFGSPNDLPRVSEPEAPAAKAKRPKPAPQFLKASQATEKALKKLDSSVSQSEPIQWSADYFKYRILGTQFAPFSFNEVMQKAESIFDEPPPYEEIKDMILELLTQGEERAYLHQGFDEGRKEIVLLPVL